MNQIRHAIIGCGRIAQNHVNACRINNMDIVSCCDIDLNKCMKFAKEHNIPNYTEDYLTLINDDSIDSVSICTDHASHVKIANDFIGKKHIIIEKPLSTNLKQSLCISNEGEKVISVIAQHRFDQLVNLVKKMLDNGDLGKITLVNSKLQCYRSHEYYQGSYWRGSKILEGGSTVINQAYHIVDTLVYLLGVPQKIKSFKNTYKYSGIIETEDTCVAIFEYPSMLCTFASTNTAIMDWNTNIEIIGTKGSIAFTIDFPENITQLFVSEGTKKKYREELVAIEKNFHSNILTAANYYGLSHNKQFGNFKAAIVDGETIKVGVPQALDTLSVINQIYNNAND